MCVSIFCVCETLLLPISLPNIGTFCILTAQKYALSKGTYNILDMYHQITLNNLFQTDNQVKNFIGLYTAESKQNSVYNGN